MQATGPIPARRASSWAGTTTALVLIGVGWLALRGDRAPVLDRWARAWAENHQQRRLFTVLDTVKDLGDPRVAGPALLVIALVVAVVRRTARPVVLTGLAFVSAAIVTFVLKLVVARSGPSGVGPPAVDGSWPSGHAVTVVVALLLLASLTSDGVLHWRPVVAWAPVAGLVDLGLVYCGHHWLSDTLVAAPLGYLLVRGSAAVVAVAFLSEPEPTLSTRPAATVGAPPPRSMPPSATQRGTADR